MLFDPQAWRNPHPLEAAVVKVQNYDMQRKMFCPKVCFTRIHHLEWRGPWPLAAKRLYKLLDKHGYRPERFQMEYPFYSAPRDIDLVMCRNARHAIGWWPISDEAVELEMVYRYVAWEDNRECKARDFIEGFLGLCKEAGINRVELVPQPFNIHPRLPFRESIKDDPDMSPQLEFNALRKLYSSLGFKESKEMMIFLIKRE